jgi:endonuclease/exonuclease/phosphatase (EEP) superfamily protein YafD
LKPQVSPDVTDLEVNPDQPTPKKHIRHRQWGGAAGGLLLGIAVLALGRAGQLWPAFDVAAQFGAQAMCLVIGFTFAALLPRFKAMFGILLSAVLILAYGVWPLAYSASATKVAYSLAPNERAISIVQFNTWRNNKDLTTQANEIERLNGDVVILQEVESVKTKLLQSLRIRYPYQFDCFAVPECDVVILSRFPMVDASAEVQWLGPIYARAKFGGEAAGLTVYGVHTTRFPHSRAQLRQVQALVKKLERENGLLIVAGDFNATPFSRIISTMEKSTGLRRLTRLPTWPANMFLPQLAIDHVFASPEIRVLVEEKIGNAAGSDHYPVVLTVAVPKP